MVGMPPLASRSPFGPLRWQAENAKLVHQLKRMGLHYMRVGYEELALYPDHMLRLICDFADLEPGHDLTDLTHTTSHIVSGNIARVDPQKRTSIRYDARWLSSSAISLLGPPLAPLQRWNRAYVYANIGDRGAADHHLFGLQRRRALSQEHN